MEKNQNILEFDKYHPETDQVFWVSGALTKQKNDPRAHLTHVYVKNGAFTATDGNRLHHYKSTENYTDGFYKVIKRAKKHIVLQNMGTDFNYPEIDRLLLPSDDSNVFGVMMDSSQCFSAYADIIRAMEKNVLNYHFLHDVLSCDDTFDAHVNDLYGTVLFQNGNKKAVIMAHRHS
jgi:hypothetical protein